MEAVISNRIINRYTAFVPKFCLASRAPHSMGGPEPWREQLRGRLNCRRRRHRLGERPEVIKKTRENYTKRLWVVVDVIY